MYKVGHMINLKISALAGALAIGLASMASAASVTFNFADKDRSKTPSIEMIDASGLKLTTTAARYSYLSGNYIDRNLGGKVKTDKDAGLSVLTGSNDSHWIDGGGTYNDVAVLTFSKTVEVKSLLLYGWDSGDKLGFSTDFTKAGPGGWVSYGGSLPSVGESSVFYLWSHYDSKVEFKLKAITVEYEESTNQTPVPLPASGVLLLGALGGAAALRRRRKA
ncbi:MAG: hypothetical protein CML02_02895 [Pseudooceanicola sp.]|jgi:hypothetical protein|nr:hypothetical protein [Pseudooceanicola sp.]